MKYASALRVRQIDDTHFPTTRILNLWTMLLSSRGL